MYQHSTPRLCWASDLTPARYKCLCRPTCLRWVLLWLFNGIDTSKCSCSSNFHFSRIISIILCSHSSHFQTDLPNSSEQFPTAHEAMKWWTPDSAHQRTAPAEPKRSSLMMARMATKTKPTEDNSSSRKKFVGMSCGISCREEYESIKHIYILLYYIISYYNVLYYIILFHIILYYIIWFYFIIYYILYYIVLYIIYYIIL